MFELAPFFPSFNFPTFFAPSPSKSLPLTPSPPLHHLHPSLPLLPSDLKKSTSNRTHQQIHHTRIALVAGHRLQVLGALIRKDGGIWAVGFSSTLSLFLIILTSPLVKGNLDLKRRQKKKKKRAGCWCLPNLRALNPPDRGYTICVCPRGFGA